MSDIKHISTSALAKQLSIPKNNLDEIFISSGYLEKDTEGFKITKKGEENGACWHTHAKYGTYIVWPENISPPNIAQTNSKEYLNATTIANKYNLSARKINMIFSEIGWIQRYLKGWNITELGKQNGGIEKENTRSGIPFIEWPKSIYDSPAFKAVINEVQGNAGEETQEKVEKSNTNDFRTKFEAKHRATDGHFVRSKAEMLIDNWLYMAEIVHAYERRLPIEEEVYCDFYIPTGKIYIEFWGLENDAKYAQRKRVKKDIYEKYNFKLIELTDEDVFNLDDVLPKMLLKFGVQTY